MEKIGPTSTECIDLATLVITVTLKSDHAELFY